MMLLKSVFTIFRNSPSYYLSCLNCVDLCYGLIYQNITILRDLFLCMTKYIYLYYEILNNGYHTNYLVTRYSRSRLLGTRIIDTIALFKQNENGSRKRKRAGKRVVDKAVKEWFLQVRKKDARINGPLLHQKAEDLAKKMWKDDFVATEGWFQRWKKR